MRIILWDDTCYDKRFVCLSDYNNHLAKYKQEEREREGKRIILQIRNTFDYLRQKRKEKTWANIA